MTLLPYVAKAVARQFASVTNPAFWPTVGRAPLHAIQLCAAVEYWQRTDLMWVHVMSLSHSAVAMARVVARRHVA